MAPRWGAPLGRAAGEQQGSPANRPIHRDPALAAEPESQHA